MIGIYCRATNPARSIEIWQFSKAFHNRSTTFLYAQPCYGWQTSKAITRTRIRSWCRYFLCYGRLRTAPASLSLMNQVQVAWSCCRSCRGTHNSTMFAIYTHTHTHTRPGCVSILRCDKTAQSNTSGDREMTGLPWTLNVAWTSYAMTGGYTLCCAFLWSAFNRERVCCVCHRVMETAKLNLLYTAASKRYATP